jgi:hypothetical protein
MLPARKKNCEVVEETVIQFSVNAHTLHCKTFSQLIKIDQFLKKVVEELMSDMESEITEHSPASSGGRLLDKGHFAHRFPATEYREQDRVQCRYTVCVCREKHFTGKGLKKLILCTVTSVTKTKYWD